MKKFLAAAVLFGALSLIGGQASDKAAAAPACSAHRVTVVSINGALPGVAKAKPCWVGLTRYHSTNAGMCMPGVSKSDWAFDEVSAAPSTWSSRGAKAQACYQSARKRAGCPPKGPCKVLGQAFYGYDENPELPDVWGLRAPMPNYASRMLELYDSSAEIGVIRRAEARWKTIRTRYGGIVGVGGTESNAALGKEVERVCRATKTGFVGLYVTSGQKKAGRLPNARVTEVVKALNRCMAAKTKPKKPSLKLAIPPCPPHYTPVPGHRGLCKSVRKGGVPTGGATTIGGG